MNNHKKLITVEDACEKALQIYGDLYVESIRDVGYGYVVYTTSYPGVLKLAPPFCFYKDGSKVETFFFPFHIEEYRKSIKLDVPEKYRIKQETRKDEIL